MENEKCIFYLTLSDKLSSNYFTLAKQFTQQGFTLLPLTYSTLLGLTNEAERLTVICMVSNATELNRYSKKVHKILKLLVQNHTINLHLVSSFSHINEFEKFRKNIDYNFYYLPVKIKSFCSIIVKSIYERYNQQTKWPGGKSPRPSMLNEL